ncbi:MAG: 50S ribosomal protein L6 [Alphaproteobacteria bacterium]|jgi:large subunit ribosomal protein L6|nr:50S ribosomal protein L6 [Alphaproteobacteria bacterium]
MSRIGKLPIEIPKGTTVEVDGQNVSAKGPKGELSLTLSELVTPSLEDGVVSVMPREDLVARANSYREALKARGKREPTFAEALEPNARTQWGTARARIANMVHGVTEGFQKSLEIQGVGYRAQMQGSDLKLSVGFSHDVVFAAPEGIEIKAPKPTEVVVSGIDKQVVGQVAAEIRAYRPPEPYKGKGVRYAGEYVRRKEGKKK